VFLNGKDERDAKVIHWGFDRNAASKQGEREVMACLVLTLIAQFQKITSTRVCGVGSAAIREVVDIFRVAACIPICLQLPEAQCNRGICNPRRTMHLMASCGGRGSMQLGTLQSHKTINPMNMMSAGCQSTGRDRSAPTYAIGKNPCIEKHVTQRGSRANAGPSRGRGQNSRD
jgi:hypothetical protein